MKKINYTILFAALTLSSFSYAENISSNFQSSAQINNTCTVGASNFDFGGVTPDESGDATTTGGVDLICTKDTSVQLKVGVGPAPGSSYTSRKMFSSDPENTSVVSYNIYTNNGHTNILGDGLSSGTHTISFIGTGTNQNIPLYGKLPLNQFVKPGQYSDNLTATLIY